MTAGAAQWAAGAVPRRRGRGAVPPRFFGPAASKLKAAKNRAVVCPCTPESGTGIELHDAARGVFRMWYSHTLKAEA